MNSDISASTATRSVVRSASVGLGTASYACSIGNMLSTRVEASSCLVLLQ